MTKEQLIEAKRLSNKILMVEDLLTEYNNAMSKSSLYVCKDDHGELEAVLDFDEVSGLEELILKLIQEKLQSLKNEFAQL